MAHDKDQDQDHNVEAQQEQDDDNDDDDVLVDGDDYDYGYLVPTSRRTGSQAGTRHVRHCYGWRCYLRPGDRIDR